MYECNPLVFPHTMINKAQRNEEKRDMNLKTLGVLPWAWGNLEMMNVDEIWGFEAVRLCFILIVK